MDKVTTYGQLKPGNVFRFEHGQAKAVKTFDGHTWLDRYHTVGIGYPNEKVVLYGPDGETETSHNRNGK